MDSEDERNLQREKSRIEEHAPWFPYPPAVCTRLYTMEEYEAEERMWTYAHPMDSEGRLKLCDNADITLVPDYRAPWRVRRFFHSYKGFLRGSLDLSGRSEARYVSLAARMVDFLADFSLVQAHTQRHQSTHIVGSETEIDIDYEVTPHSILEAFQDKWRLHVCSLEIIFTLVDELRAVSVTLGHPQFQRLYLMDLPPELILNILKWAGMSGARSLGATCRTLHEVSIPFIFEKRTLALGFNYQGLRKAIELDDEDIDVWLRDEIARARHKLLLDAELVASRPDIAGRIKDVILINNWDSTYLRRAGLPVGSGEHVAFFKPICNAFAKVLTCTSNVTTIDIYSTLLTNGILTGLSSIPGLRTLTLYSCSLPALLFSPEGMTLNALRNITILSSSDHPGELDTMDFDSLLVLGLAINARSIALAGANNGPLAIDALDQSDHNPFISVERFIMEGCTWSAVFWVRSKALEAAASPAGLRLTHFKFHGMHGIVMQDVVEITDGLRSAPLRVLSLEGLDCADEELFLLLAGAFPLLHALTLYYRECDRDTTNKAARWPGSTWEYARYLSSFHALEHFGWNFSIEPFFSSTTFDFTRMEEGYVGKCHYTESDLYFSDWSCLPRLFAAYCPMLSSLAFLAGSSKPPDGFSISRDDSGKIRVEDHTKGGAKFGEGMRRYDWACPNAKLFIAPNPWLSRADEGD